VLELIARNRKARLWRTLGLPNLKYLRLDRNERKTVWAVLNQSIEAAMTALSTIRDFYLNHLTVYWKFKHGLSLLLGAPTQGQLPVESLLYAFDRNSERPKGHSTQMAEKLSPPFEWFNILQVVPYTERAFKNIAQILNAVKELTFTITNNHLTWADNCGQDYLPAKREGDQARAYAHGAFSEEIKEAYDKIFLRVGSNMTLATRTINFDFNFRNEAGKEGFQRLADGKPITYWITPEENEQKPGSRFERSPKIE
jgi:hypothetical protein